MLGSATAGTDAAVLVFVTHGWAADLSICDSRLMIEQKYSFKSMHVLHGGCLVCMFSWKVMGRDATPPPKKSITSTASHHRIANNYRQLPDDYGSLPANYQHLYGFHYNECLPLPAIYRQDWSVYRSLSPVMKKNYLHVGNEVMKSCTSSTGCARRWLFWFALWWCDTLLDH